MKPELKIVALLAASIALCGCQQEKEPERATAGGEILPASASDAMLPLDTVRSQPPLAPQPTATAKAGARKSATGTQAAADPTQEPTGAPTPADDPAVPQESNAAN